MAGKATAKISAKQHGTKGPSDDRLITLFLDMLAAERGAGKNTLSRLWPRPRRFRRASRRPAFRRDLTTDDIRAYSGRTRLARHASRDGGAAPVGHPPALPFLLCGRPARRRSGRRA